MTKNKKPDPGIVEVTIYEDGEAVILGLTKYPKILDLEKSEELVAKYREEFGEPPPNRQLGLTMIPLIRTVNGCPLGSVINPEDPESEQELVEYTMDRYLRRMDIRMDIIAKIGKVLAATFRTSDLTESLGASNSVVRMPG